MWIETITEDGPVLYNLDYVYHISTAGNGCDLGIHNLDGSTSYKHTKESYSEIRTKLLDPDHRLTVTNYRIKEAAKECRYAVLSIHHDEGGVTPEDSDFESILIKHFSPDPQPTQG